MALSTCIGPGSSLLICCTLERSENLAFVMFLASTIGPSAWPTFFFFFSQWVLTDNSHTLSGSSGFRFALSQFFLPRGGVKVCDPAQISCARG